MASGSGGTSPIDILSWILSNFDRAFSQCVGLLRGEINSVSLGVVESRSPPSVLPGFLGDAIVPPTTVLSTVFTLVAVIGKSAAFAVKLSLCTPVSEFGCTCETMIASVDSVSTVEPPSEIFGLPIEICGTSGLSMLRFVSTSTVKGSLPIPALPIDEFAAPSPCSLVPGCPDAMEVLALEVVSAALLEFCGLPVDMLNHATTAPRFFIGGVVSFTAMLFSWLLLASLSQCVIWATDAWHVAVVATSTEPMGAFCGVAAADIFNSRILLSMGDAPFSCPVSLAAETATLR